MSDRAAAYIDEHFDHFIAMLTTLTKIPSVSADPKAGPAMRACAEAVVAQMKEAGLTTAEVLELEGAHPYAYGEWLGASGKPTLLLYAHHDVQPPGRPSYWKTPPFEPTMRADGRLYARGIVDDKAGIVTHLAALKAWFATEGKPPVNIKMIVEGEEEIGSENLERFLKAHQAKLQADVIVLTDTANLEAGLPSLTYRLRGICNVEVEIAGLDHPLHSGMWGGPIADPVQAMAKVLATLSDEHGAPAIPGLMDDVRAPTALERAEVAKLPYDEAQFRSDGGVLAGAKLVGEPGFGTLEKVWVRPSVTVIALEASPIEGSSNQVVPSARCRISVRLVPDMDPAKIGQLVVDHVKRVCPWGMTVTAAVEHGAPAWMCAPEGPAFDAARRALAKGFGREVALIGCGGSIPFVGPFAEAFGGAPALLIGLEDPICNAHSENESLHMEDWRRAMKGAVYLYEELAAFPRKG